MIFLTGGTGNVGSAIAARLAGSGTPVRGLARSAASRQTLLDLGLDAVDGDFGGIEDLQSAMAGCDRLFLLSPPHPDQVRREQSVIDAAGRAGVRHIVALSVLGSDRSSPSVFGRWHAEIDDHLIGSGLDFTILRPNAFMPVHLWPIDTIMAEGRWYGMTGDGACAFIDVDDIAAVAVETLTADRHAGRIYELTGPEAITLPQAARVVSEILGRPVDYIDLPPETFRANMVATGAPDWLIDGIVALYAGIRAGHAATVTNIVPELLGRPGHHYREFVAAHLPA